MLVFRVNWFVNLNESVLECVLVIVFLLWFTLKRAVKDRLQNYLIFCFQNTQSFKGFWKEFRSSYFVTIPKIKNPRIFAEIRGF